MGDAGLPELSELERIIALAGAALEVRTEGTVTGPLMLPLVSLAMGAPGASTAVGFFGGVHGLERIGAQVVIAYLHSLVMRLRWDTLLQRLLETTRLVFMPVVNPGGMLRNTRANPNGVDLMRNGPTEATGGAPFLVGGQRISSGLPWYRGQAGAPLEVESAALCAVVARELTSRPFSLALDCHSGFGMRDRVWFPYAHRPGPIPHLAQLHALLELFEQSNSHHRYRFEPQSHQYLTHGDLWDHLYLDACSRPGRVFLPLTLEMGSWLWVKKNPRQLFSRHGMFNPLIAHREQRVLRSHLPLLDFATRAAASWAQWQPQGQAIEFHRQAALDRWFGSVA